MYATKMSLCTWQIQRKTKRCIGQSSRGKQKNKNKTKGVIINCKKTDALLTAKEINQDVS